MSKLNDLIAQASGLGAARIAAPAQEKPASEAPEKRRFTLDEAFRVFKFAAERRNLGEIPVDDALIKHACALLESEASS